MRKNKNQIIQAIDAKIITNGNINAVDTNRILKDILDCEELNHDNGSKLIPFHFWSPNVLADRKGAKLWYSFKGLTEQFVNFTFVIKISKPNVTSFNFISKDQSEIFEILSKIINPEIQNQMEFLVKIKNADEKVSNKFKKVFRTGSMSFEINDDRIIIQIESQELSDKLFAGDEIFSSITFHCPNFNFSDNK